MSKYDELVQNVHKYFCFAQAIKYYSEKTGKTGISVDKFLVL